MSKNDSYLSPAIPNRNYNSKPVFMKKRLLYLATTLLLAGCAQDFDLAEPPVTEPQQETSGTLTRSVDGAVYNEVTDAWMIPLADPFALENVQAAYDRIAEGQSTQPLTRAEADGFTPGEKLEPTHYALKIYPKSEEEQWRVETMEDVKVAYIPFSYSQLTHEEVARVEQSGKTRSAANTFTEKSPYTVTYDYTGATDGGPTGPVTYQLPILYAVWPADKPFPDDLEYVVDYPVFLPYPTVDESVGNEAVSTLGNDAVMTRFYPMPPIDFIVLLRYDYTGYVTTYDSTLNAEVPMANLRMRYQEGSYIVDFVTDSSGRFELRLLVRPLPKDLQDIIDRLPDSWYNPGHYLPLTCVYQDPSNRWRITSGNDDIELTEPLGVYDHITFEQTYKDAQGNRKYNTHISLSEGDYRENAIHRAVNYFYNVQNIFPKHYPSGGTRIIARNVSGRSYYTPANKVINIYGHGRTDGDVIGSTLHELGHLFHDLSDPASFFDTNIFLYESFACYAGWYLTQTYYESLGWVLPYPSYDITTRNARQAWGKNDAIGSASGEYSPLFVDLTDSYNQRINSYYQHRPNDNIQGVPPSVVWNIISTSKTWTQCRAKLLSYAGAGTGKYYTTAQFNEWIEAFDAWVSLYY